jgi:integrase
MTIRARGEGSLYQRHDRGCPPLVDGVRPDHKCAGPWIGVYTIGHRDGRPIRKKVTAPTRAGAAARLRELKEKHSADELPEGKAVTVAEWMRYWLEKIVPRAKPSDSTLKVYRTNVEQYIVPLLGSHKLDRLSPEHIDEAWDVLLTEGGKKGVPLSPNSVHLAHTILSRALKVAVQRRRLVKNPAGSDAMDAPPRRDKEIEPIPPADMEKILAAADDPIYAARWSVALALGLRPGEALGLRWDDVDLTGGVLHVRQQLQRVKGRGLVATPPKSDAGRRSMSLPPTLLAALKAHRKAQNEARLMAGDHWTDTGLVFTLPNGKGVDPGVDRDRWHALLERAQVTPRRLYDARHSAATLLLAQGVPTRTVMDLLGHSQMSITARYQHVVDEMKVDAAAKIEAGMWGN